MPAPADKLRLAFAFVSVVGVGLASPPSVGAEELAVSSPAFNEGGAIPSKYSCDGGDLVPPLAWRGVPDKARSLALIVVDPDVPDPAAPVRSWVHWVVYAIPPGTEGIAESHAENALPPGAKEGLNDWKRTRYGGPCPPKGKHRYYFRLYALDTTLAELANPTKADLETAMDGHVVASAVLMGTYERTKSKETPGK